MGKPIISETSRSLMDIAWYFGPKGLNGECCDNLSMPEFLALDKISTSRDCPVQDVGNSLGFTKSGATRIVNRLEKKGYVQKIKSNEDARFCCVVITEKGKNVIKAADLRYVKQFEEMLSKMPGKIASKTKEVLAAMARTIKG